jgi:hypothetical protein
VVLLQVHHTNRRAWQATGATALAQLVLG